MAMWCSTERQGRNGRHPMEVTAQPSWRHMNVELRALTEVVKPQMEMGLENCPPPAVPRKKSHGNENDSQEWFTSNRLELVGGLLCGCMLRAGWLETDKDPEGEVKSSSYDQTESALKGSLRKRKRPLRKDTLISTTRGMLGMSTNTKTVTFNPVHEVKYIETCRELYPPTLHGAEVKRRAFWSVYETENNLYKWNNHFESSDSSSNKNKNVRGACQCLGCLIDVEDTEFTA